MTLNSIIANFQTFKLADLLDIIIIAFLIYQLLGIINRTRRRAYSAKSSLEPSTSTLERSAVTRRIRSTRSSRENMGCFPAFTITQTMSRSKILAARRIISRWPLVTGSKEPG